MVKLPIESFRTAGVLLALLSGTALSGQSAARTLKLTTSHLSDDSVHYRLVPLNGASVPGTSGWTIGLRFVKYGSRPAVMQVMTVSTRGGESSDTLLFDRATLLPIWEHDHGQTNVRLSYGRRHVTGSISSTGAAARAIDIVTPTPAFSTTSDDIVTQSLPLAMGYHVVIPFVAEDRVEYDTVKVQRSEDVRTATGVRAAWVVTLAEPNTTELLWIDRIDRHVLRHVYASKSGQYRYDLVADESRS